MSRSPCAVCGNGFTSSLAPTPEKTLELTNILRFNAVPPDVGSFRSTILAAPTELALYDAEIERIQKILAGLVSERSALATYAEGCRRALSPIRRVPTELWAKIFDLCSPYLFQEVFNLSLSTTPEEEVDRLSNRHLLQLSQVSSLWHKIAMGTPKLWSTIALDTSLWDSATISQARLLSLLDLSLKRGGNHPLVMDIGVLQEHPQSHAIVILLSKHAPRWKDVYFLSDLDSAAQLLTSAKGNLQRLEKLSLNAEWRAVDTFQAAPRLTDVKFSGRVETLPDLPWAQIRTFAYASVAAPDAFNFLSILGRCQNIITFESFISLSELPIDTNMPPVASDVEFLTFRLELPRERSFVGRIFEALTLPALRSLTVAPRKLDDVSPPVWDAERFLGLADRSSFHTHLTRLEIDALITDEGLLGCLIVLPLLEELIISDCSFDDEHIVISDTLLHGLIHTVDARTPNLVPKLHFLSLTSRLHFADSVYRELLISRLPLGRDDSFKTHLWFLPDRRREFPAEVLTEVSNLDHKGFFSFNCGPSG
ncbi:hypothetical protein DFH06DRAFT_1299657 [Mycena polygramma]|nr:hypothetical protein DFH06DRAFT_1299657 [Mycena polygramma]